MGKNFSVYSSILFDYFPHLSPQDIANLIVDRTTVVNHILPQEEGRENELAHLTLTALYSLYFNYLTKAKKPNKEAYSWVCLVNTSSTIKQGNRGKEIWTCDDIEPLLNTFIFLGVWLCFDWQDELY